MEAKYYFMFGSGVLICRLCKNFVTFIYLIKPLEKLRKNDASLLLTHTVELLYNITSWDWRKSVIVGELML